MEARVILVALASLRGRRRTENLICNSATQLSFGDVGTLTEVDGSNGWIFWVGYGVKFIVATMFLLRGWDLCKYINVVAILLGDDRAN